MSPPKQGIISKSEIQNAFEGQDGQRFPIILTTEEVGQLLHVSKKTIYEWVRKGNLDKTYIKRGKRRLFLRNKLIDKMFNGKDWN
tara:strand:+ start:537 stop:791 length:255 start_codon:yes stop_codon:yes gene_type:complete